MDNHFEIKDKFYLNGKEIKIISGGMHYFRVVPEYWRDRLIKLKNLGCNTVETYVPWNMHEPAKGRFCFEGMLDLKAYIELAQELGLWVIIRPSPYICAEWEFGGLPAWLLAEEGMRLRGSYGPFLRHIEEYYRELFKIITPLQINNLGPIILLQIENEYGYYGDDTNYLEALRDIMAEQGAVVPFVTSDGPWGDALNCGSLPEALPTANFGSKAKEQFQLLSDHTKGRPLMCMEFWIGWFDHWGNGGHVTSSLKDNLENLRDILQLGNVNIYMFHGGTNFGFTSGSNYYDELTPDVTSYDYDALLSEDGRITPKYEAFARVIREFTEAETMPLLPQVKPYAYGEVRLTGRVGLNESLEDLSARVDNIYPKSMEQLGQNYGYILYRSELKKESRLEKLRLWEANDRAQIFVDNKLIATLYDRELLSEIEIKVALTGSGKMDILVENMGRVNFGAKLERQRKGINGAVQVNSHQHFGWQHYPLPLDNLDRLDFTGGYVAGLPAFYLFEFEADQMCDTFLELGEWGKGCAFINGFNLGRFWKIGPQKRLYIPGPLIKKGKNSIILFETEGVSGSSITLTDKPDLG